MTKFLLSGGSGFLAAHVLEQLIEGGHTVVTTVRSEDKAQKIRDAHKNEADRLQVVIVPDLAKEDAFDEVVKIMPFDAVIHTASPFHFNWTDAKKELIDPAVNGTMGLLKAIKRSAPTVKRVVITSSFAAVINESEFANPDHVFTESSWNPDGLADIGRTPPTAYRVSKKLAELAAWDFVADEKPGFDLATICPPLIIGPVVHHLATLDSINVSCERVVTLLRGGWKEGIASGGPVGNYVDVRDCARAHIRAVELTEAGGRRFITTGGATSNREITDIVRENFPEYADRLPGPDVKGGEPASPTFQLNNEETNRVLKLDYIPIKNSIIDLVKTLKENGI